MTDGELIIKEIKQNKIINPNSEEWRANEWRECRNNPFYFIYNYVYIRETGSSLKITSQNLHPKMKRVVRCIYKYHNAVLMASRQLGKALSLDTIIPLANGQYTTMGDIKIGDMILDDKNQPTQVINMTNVMYDRPCYQIYFDNDEKVIADARHLWRCYNKISNEDRLYPTESLVNNPSNFIIYGIDKIFKIKSITPIRSVPVKCIQVSNSNGMFLCTKKKIPTHNSTISACILAWALIFYPDNKAIILNMKQNAAMNNLATIRYIIDHLPRWMVTNKPFQSKSGIQSYLILFNNSRVDAFFPSTVHPGSTLARSLTSPILYIDESAFIKYMGEIYGSAQQTLSKAREQAIKNKYPYFILITSTPKLGRLNLVNY